MELAAVLDFKKITDLKTESSLPCSRGSPTCMALLFICLINPKAKAKANLKIQGMMVSSFMAALFFFRGQIMADQDLIFIEYVAIFLKK